MCIRDRLETKETSDKLDQQYNLPKLNFLYNGDWGTKRHFKTSQQGSIPFQVLIMIVHTADKAQGQDGWILAKFSFCVFMDHVEVIRSIKT